METKPAWAARCECYNGHASSSGRCTCRETRGIKKHGVTDPTAKMGQAVFCEECRQKCPRAIA